jgi:outer membrane protein assembly factor BamB
MKQRILLALVLLPLFTQAQTVNWSFAVKDASFGNAAAADLDGDGKAEIVFSCYWNDSNVYVLNAQTGALKWKKNLGGCNDAAPLIHDVDADGKPEVIVASSCKPVTTCFNGATGAVKWQTATGGSDSPPSIADIDGDGQLEILHGQFNGHVICLNAKTGSVEWDLVVDEDASIQTDVAILDADKDGKLDFIVGTWSYDDTNRIYCYRGSNRSQMWVSKLPKDLIYHGAAFGDIDRDGKPEITIGDYAANLFCLNAENGSPVWIDSFPTPYNYIGAPTTLADLNRDHYLDVIYCDNYHVGAVKHDGNQLWTYTIPNYGTAFRGVAVADVNNDNVLDVTFGTSKGTVTSLDGMTGSLIRTMDLRAVYGDTFDVDHAPLIADFNGDGLKDVFIVGGKARYPNINVNYGKAYCLSWGAGKGPDWSMFRHDARRSACLCDASGLPISPLIIPDGASPGEALRVYPNPVANELRLETQLGGAGKVFIRILDLTGKTVLTAEAIAQSQFSWKGDISALPTGSYLIELQYARATFRRHFLVLR